MTDIYAGCWRGEHLEAWRYRTGIRYRTNAARALGISLKTYTKYEFNKLPIPLDIAAKCSIIQHDMCAFFSDHRGPIREYIATLPPLIQ